MKKYMLVLVIVVISTMLALSSCSSAENSSTTDSSASSDSSSDSSSSDSSDDSSTASNTDTVGLGIGDENVLVVAETEGNGIYNDWYRSAALDRNLSFLIAERIVDTDDKGAFIVNDLLVDNMEISEDGLDYTFTLNENVTFSDGTKMTANDVAFTFKAMLSASCTARNKPLPSEFAGIEEFQAGGEFTSVEATDDKTVVFHFVEAKRTNLVTIYGPILSEADFPDMDWTSIDTSMETNIGSPLGTGAYTIKDNKPGEYIVFEKNAKYHAADKTDYKIEKIVVRYIKPDIAVEEIKIGEINFLPGIMDKEKVDELEAEENIELSKFLTSVYYYIGFNTTENSNFQYKSLRQAIAYAIDREEFCEAQFGDLGYPIDIPMSPAVEMFDKIEATGEIKKYTKDIEKAKEILLADGFTYDGDTLVNPDGEPTKVKFFSRADNAVMKVLVPVLEESCNELGVALEVESIDFNAMLDTLKSSDAGWDMFFVGRTWPNADPDYWKAWEPDYAAGNYPRYFNKDIDAALAEGRQYLDASAPETVAAYKKVAVILNEDLPEFAFYGINQANAARPEVKGLDASTFLPWTKAIAKGTTVEATK